MVDNLKSFDFNDFMRTAVHNDAPEEAQFADIDVETYEEIEQHGRS